jgi:hypothetical protein
MPDLMKIIEIILQDYKRTMDEVYYDDKQGICEIIDVSSKSSNDMMEIVEEKNLPKDTKVFVCLSLENPETLLTLVPEYVDKGFSLPSIRTKSPLNNSINMYMLCLEKVDMKSSGFSGANSSQMVYDTVEDWSNMTESNCKTKYALSEDTVKQLKTLSFSEPTRNKDSSMTQKEHAGAMYVSGMSGDVNVLDINQNKWIEGKEQGVAIVEALYNFHSHPEEAYITNKVNKAWPSAQDYIGFLLAVLEDNTILHIVVAIEGVYIISLSEYYAGNKDKLSPDVAGFINSNFNYCGKLDNSINWFIKNINTVKYKGHPLFITEFIPWDKATKDFTIYYCKTNGKCLVK